MFLGRLSWGRVSQPLLDLFNGLRADAAPAVDRTVGECPADDGRVQKVRRVGVGLKLGLAVDRVSVSRIRVL